MFAQTLSVRLSAAPFIIVSTVESTNNYAMAKLHADLVAPGACIIAVEQTAGKGQRGKQWQSARGENITLSIILPAFHHFTHPFIESATIAICCYDFIKDLGIDHVSVKWPNDVYIGDRKAAGILVENVFRGTEWRYSIAGIGININQTQFSSDVVKAASVKLATGKDFNVTGLARLLHNKIIEDFNVSANLSPDEILSKYNSILYKKGEEVKLKKDSRVFTTRIIGVLASGELQTRDTLDQSFSVGEVEFV